ncbi:tetratricopeptide repeat protein [Serratia sp. 2723]|uniref:tetratricopeptide repeat protein n=1 Tax=unclassified Serratia (in: enterobacteria) TaxID=2647522 RepID=UPI003D24A5D9
MRRILNIIFFMLFIAPGFSHAAMMADEENFKEGYRFYTGDGVDVNDLKAAEFFQKSGNALSNYYLANMYMYVDEGLAKYSVRKDKARANELLKIAIPSLKQGASSGDPSAQLYLGYAYLSGMGLEKNEKEALKLIKQSAEQDYAPALYLLGTMLEKSDPDKAYHYYEKAVTLGFREAYEGLVNINNNKYLDTFNPIYKDNIIKLAAEGNPYAILWVARDEDLSRHYDKAMVLFNTAAKDNLASVKASAFAMISLMYHRGEGVEKSRTMSLKYLNEACRFSKFECYNRDVYKDGKETWP